MKKLWLSILLLYSFHFFACDPSSYLSLPPIKEKPSEEVGVLHVLSSFINALGLANESADSLHTHVIALSRPGVMQGDVVKKIDNLLAMIKGTTDSTSHIQRIVLMVTNILEDIRYQEVNGYAYRPVERSEQDGGRIQRTWDKFSEDIDDASHHMYWLVPWLKDLLRLAEEGGNIPYRVDRWSRNVMTNNKILNELVGHNRELFDMVQRLQQLSCRRKRSGSCPHF